MASPIRAAARYHGDQAALPGMLDFAVNVRSGAVAEAGAGARRLAALRGDMVAALRGLGLDVVDGVAPFVLFAVPDAELMRKHLESKGIAVRRCDTFVGLPGHYLRVAVRPEWPVLADAVREVL